MSDSSAYFIILIEIVLGVLIVASLWKIFDKAGQPGWAAIIPIYNTYVLLKVAGKPGWWLLLLFIPFVNLVIAIMAIAGLASNFGKSGGFVLGLLFLPFVFYPILAFGDAKYQGESF